MYFALGLLSRGKPWGILVKDVKNTCITTLGSLKQEGLKCALASPRRGGKARYDCHNTFHPLSRGIPHPEPESYSHRLSLQPQISVPRAAAQRQEDPSPTETRFDPWKAGRNKWNWLIFPISHRTETWGRAVNGRSEKSIKSPFSTTAPSGKQHMLRLGAPGTPSDPTQGPAALLTL